MIGSVEDERDRMVSLLCFENSTLLNTCMKKINIKMHINELIFPQLTHANSQLIIPLETFRKEQIGGAKVGTSIECITKHSGLTQSWQSLSLTFAFHAWVDHGKIGHIPVSLNLIMKARLSLKLFV